MKSNFGIGRGIVNLTFSLSAFCSLNQVSLKAIEYNNISSSWVSRRESRFQDHLCFLRYRNLLLARDWKRIGLRGLLKRIFIFYHKNYGNQSFLLSCSVEVMMYSLIYSDGLCAKYDVVKRNLLCWNFALRYKRFPRWYKASCFPDR